MARGRPLVYSPRNTAAQQWREDVRMAVMRDAPRDAGHGGAWEVRLRFGMLLPKSRAGRFHGQDHAQKPDLDNLVKLVMDAVTSTRALWLDDCQVSRVSAVKEWVGSGDDEGVSIVAGRV